MQTKKMKSILLTALFFILFSCIYMPFTYAYAGTTEFVSMRAGNSMTLHLNSSKAGTKGSWISMDPSTVAIQSQNYVSCTVKAVRETSGQPVIIRCNYTYITSRGKYSYIMNDYKDFYITVQKSSSSNAGSDGGSSGGSYSLSASPGTMYLDLAGGTKELTLTAGETLSSTLYIRTKPYSSGCVSVGKLKETNGNRQGFIVSPESVGRQTVRFELIEQVRPNYEVIKKSVNVNFVVTCSHTYDKGTVTKEPTATAPGVKTYTCKHCKRQKTEQIAWERKNIADCKITVNSNSLIYDGLAKTPSVSIEDQGKKLVQNSDYLLSYSDNTNAGTGLIEIKGTGSYTGQTSRSFIIGKSGQNLSASITTNLLTVGQTARITASAPGKIRYHSSNEQIVSVDNRGLATGKKTGTAVITVTAEETDNYKTASKTFTITVKETPSSVKEPEEEDSEEASETISPVLAASATSVKLTRGHSQDIVISVSKGFRSGLSLTAKPLSPNIYAEWIGRWKDHAYSLRIWGYAAGNEKLAIYLNDESSDKILATMFIHVTVAGKTAAVPDKPDTSDTADTTDTADSADQTNTVDISACSLRMGSSRFTYTGMQKKPFVLLLYNYHVLKEDKDYTIEYLNNVNAGTAEIRISGKGNYSGTVTRTFTISKANQWFICLPHRRRYSATALMTDSITFDITVMEAKGMVSYQSSDSRYITVSNGTARISRNTPAGTYEITVTAAGDENYKAASSTITVSIR